MMGMDNDCDGGSMQQVEGTPVAGGLCTGHDSDDLPCHGEPDVPCKGCIYWVCGDDVKVGLTSVHEVRRGRLSDIPF